VVIADLEDAVAPERKAEARDLVARLRPRVVRINGAETEWFADDVALTGELELDAVVLPKATPESVEALGPEGPPVIAIVETAQGLRVAYETAASPRVELLMLGSVDLGVELRLEPRPDGLEILYARSQLVIDSAAAEIGAPIDVVHLDFRDLAGLEESARFARSVGFGGKACIHPDQVAIVNRVFAPESADVEWARRVVEAYERGEREGKGAVALEGTMVDLPVVERARQVLAEAKGGAA
jgi:citrate lyase beta subunit